MTRRILADTVEQISRLQAAAPMPLAVELSGDTRVVRPFRNVPIDAYVPAMKHHVLAPVLRGDGSSSARIDGRQHQALSVTGGVTLMPRGLDGSWSCPGTPVCSNVYLSRERLQLCADEVGDGRNPELVPRLNFEDPTLFAILRLISLEPDPGAGFSRLCTEQLLDLLCLHLLRSHSAFPTAVAFRHTGLTVRQVRRVTEYMRDHLDDSLGLEELAALVGLSRFHFCTAFRKATGWTPHQWLVRTRMKRARELLADPGLRITDVAFAVGYQTPSSFTLAFRKAWGLSPAGYRRRL